MNISNPKGRLEPAWLGQMFFDPGAHAFYQARGLTADDWQLIHPDDMVGSFVKIYDHFIGIPQNDDQTPLGIQRHKDAIVVRETMKIAGLEIMDFGGLCWDAEDKVIYLVKLRFIEVAGRHVFLGFVDEAPAWKMPYGLGLYLREGVIWFCNSARVGKPIGYYRDGDVATFRLEISNVAEMFQIDISLSGKDIANPVVERLPVKPVLALFDCKRGPRPVSGGYDYALQRNMDAAK